VELGPCISLLGKRSPLFKGGGVITALKRCPTIIKISPCRPHAKEKRDDEASVAAMRRMAVRVEHESKTT